MDRVRQERRWKKKVVPVYEWSCRSSVGICSNREAPPDGRIVPKDQTDAVVATLYKYIGVKNHYEDVQGMNLSAAGMVFSPS